MTVEDRALYLSTLEELKLARDVLSMISGVRVEYLAQIDGTIKKGEQTMANDAYMDIEMPAPKWSHEEAVELCRKIEKISPEFGYHVALTGGTLYKDGPRKDCDILFYRIRQVEEPNYKGLFLALESAIGLRKVSGFGWCHKAVFEHKNIDCFFPEETGGEDVPNGGY